MSNPYQIRTDILAMAKEILDKQYDMQMEVAHRVMDMHKENAELANELLNEAQEEVDSKWERLELFKSL